MGVPAFGKYEVLARLATGGTANIFFARQAGAAGFHKGVALKTLRADRARDDEFVAMFLDEARLAARLNHPHCVQIYDLGRVRGVYYISMEYIFGETVWNLLTTVSKRRKPLPPRSVARIVAEACDGLHHAHELKDPTGQPYRLVHRDVSPQNLMVSFEGRTHIVDFGIAKAETGRDATDIGVVKGKFSYMSPEQITGAEVDRRSDVFSLGVVLWECLASRRLFPGQVAGEVARKILDHPAPRVSELVPDVPPALDAICARALERRLEKRFPSALDMGAELRAYLAEVASGHASDLAALMRDRFGAESQRRRAALAAALETSNGQPLVDAFGATLARRVDLFPAEAVDGPDFVEASRPEPVPAASKTEAPRPSQPEVEGFPTAPEAMELAWRPPDLDRDDDPEAHLDDDATAWMPQPSSDPPEVSPSARPQAPIDETSTAGAAPAPNQDRLLAATALGFSAGVLVGMILARLLFF